MGVRCLCLLRWDAELKHILVAIGLSMGHGYEQYSDIWYARRIKGIRVAVHGTPLSGGSSSFLEINPLSKLLMDIYVDDPRGQSTLAKST